MHSPAGPILRRPNGRPQACEPCRKRKVACDHTHPICNRCRKRRQTDDCVYLVLGRASPTPHRLPPSPSCTGTLAVPQPGASDASDPAVSRNSEPGQMANGYLGFTSFSAVYEETQISLSRLQGSLTTPSESGERSREASALDQFTLDPRTRDACLFVLQNVPDFEHEAGFLGGSQFDSWYYSFLQQVLSSFYETFGHYFGPQKSDKSLEELATILSKNTTLPFSDEEDLTAAKWMAQFSGPRTRWETLGLFFAFSNFNLKVIDIGDGCPRDNRGPPSSVAKKCVDFCVDLCHEFSPPNSMMLFLTYKKLQLETILYGDMSRRAWLLLGEVVTLLTFLGYHVLSDSPDYQPSYVVEIKRRLYYQVYITHMTLVSLTGRPPLLSQGYHTTPLPLDISDSILFSSNNDFITSAKADIGATGWNKHAMRFPVSFLRARATLSLLREEIMQFALSTKRLVTIEDLLNAKNRELQTIDEFPAFVKYDDSDLDDQINKVGVIFWKLLMRLEHLLNMFFLERLLLRHGYAQSELLSVSFEMISYTLPFWTHQDTLLPLRNDCEWLVMAYGVPAGGILCQELLMPTLHNDPRITRSSLIQKLSLLVGFLDWIKPTAPNGDLCGKCKTIIKHVLDQALDGPPPGFEGAPGFAFDWDFTTQVDFDFDLLNTFGWTRDPSSSHQPNA
ncbi:hypothetical protein F5Y14DRAFT_464709 [Nemania sp. NC0429]|nr:hypothetical protein F5Y14DRAFT_464709 [Nemania sp. NC0429]